MLLPASFISTMNDAHLIPIPPRDGGHRDHSTTAAVMADHVPDCGLFMASTMYDSVYKLLCNYVYKLREAPKSIRERALTNGVIAHVFIYK